MIAERIKYNFLIEFIQHISFVPHPPDPCSCPVPEPAPSTGSGTGGRGVTLVRAASLAYVGKVMVPAFSFQGEGNKG
jgi:hypothetical protein